MPRPDADQRLLDLAEDDAERAELTAQLPTLRASDRRRLIKRMTARRRYGGTPASRGDRIRAWVNSIFSDHAFIRAIYLNLHRVGPEAWRSAQPLPGQIRALARKEGLRTVLSLRGGVLFGSAPLEREACAREGVAFENFVLRSRALPTKEELAELDALIGRIERPVLFHCKAGADRAGLMSVLWLILAEGEPVATARRHLSLRYGHLRTGPTGILDLFMDRAEEAEARGVPFRDWIETGYDPEALTAEFKAQEKSGLGKLLVDRILRRE